MKIGIIGAENSHTIRIGEILNVKKMIKGASLDYVWGETDKFAKIAAKQAKIPNIVKHPKDMIGKIDAVIVDHRHGKYHLKAVLPFIKEGIPTFVDKPFCYRLKEGREFLKLARKYKTPVTEIAINGNSFLTRLLSSVWMGLFLAYYMAMEYGLDPTPVKIVEQLKKDLK